MSVEYRVGCAACQGEWAEWSGGGRHLKEVAASKSKGVALYRCTVCGAWWSLAVLNGRPAWRSNDEAEAIKNWIKENP